MGADARGDKIVIVGEIGDMDLDEGLLEGGEFAMASGVA